MGALVFVQAEIGNLRRIPAFRNDAIGFAGQFVVADNARQRTFGKHLEIRRVEIRQEKHRADTIFDQFDFVPRIDVLRQRVTQTGQHH